MSESGTIPAFFIPAPREGFLYPFFRKRLKNEEMKNKVEAYELADDLKNFEGLTLEMLAALGAKDIKTLDDFADLAGDEVVEIVGKDVLSLDDANALIIKAREHWFDEETSEK